VRSILLSRDKFVSHRTAAWGCCCDELGAKLGCSVTGDRIEVGVCSVRIEGRLRRSGIDHYVGEITVALHTSLLVVRIAIIDVLHCIFKLRLLLFCLCFPCVGTFSVGV
jgi:hypothetical protein